MTERVETIGPIGSVVKKDLFQTTNLYNAKLKAGLRLIRDEENAQTSHWSEIEIPRNF